MTSPINNRLLQLFALLFLLLAGQAMAQGKLEKIRVHSPSLEGNLQGNDAERDVWVYLPPGYERGNRRYPVVYFLHGYAVTAEVYVNDVLRIPASTDAAMAGGQNEFIIVMPDAFTRFGGSFYANSPTIGDWESWIAKDLVAHIDSRYRTIARREARGLSGHSMGGYGTLRIAMRYPEKFGAIYSMSAGALINRVPGREQVREQWARMTPDLRSVPRNSSDSMQALASAFLPNTQNPPWYFDLPYDPDGNAVPFAAERWVANGLLVSVDQNVPALKSFRGIMLDVGNEDGLEDSNTRFAAALERLGVEHRYEIYPGNHGNRVGARFIEKVLPFFAEKLTRR